MMVLLFARAGSTCSLSCWKHLFVIVLEAPAHHRAGSTCSSQCWKHLIIIVLEALSKIREQRENNSSV
jgi:hypothetical protein